MANALLTIGDITRETIAVFHEECQLLKACTRKYESRFAKSGAKVGNSVDIRKAVKYSVTNGADLTGALQDANESVVTLKVDQRKTIGMNFTDEDLTLKIDDFSQRFIRPAAQRLAREVDLTISVEIAKYGQRLARVITNAITFSDVTRANAQLSAQLAPGDRTLYIDAFTDADIVNENRGLFQSAEKIAAQYEKGVMGIAGGFKFVETENVGSIAFSGTITAAVKDGVSVNGATTFDLDGITGTATEIKAGQAFTLDGVYQVDPETLAAQPRLYTFIASADADITAGAATVSIAAPIYAIGYANKSEINVSALPADNAVGVFLEGAAAAGDVAPLVYAMAQGAVAFASVDLELPGSNKMEGRENYDGVSLRIVKFFDGLKSESAYRLDILYGVKVIEPQYMASMIGKV